VKIINVAFVGGGINSAVGSAHYAAINLDRNFKLVSGFFSRNNVINEQSAQKYRIEKKRLYYSIEELILNEKNNLDAIIILTPTDQHANQVIKCLKNGIPVICEKALARSKEEINKINKSLVENNGYLAVIYNYLGYPIIRELKEIISNGILGEIIHIQIEMPQESLIKKNKNGNPIIPQKWRMEDKIIPTISLDLGVHLHMLNKYLLAQKPIRVVAKSESKGNHNSIIDNVNCLIEYSDNTICNMWFSKIASGARNGMKIRIYGKKGSAEWIQENPEILYLADSQGKRWILDRTHPDAIVCNQKKYERFKAGHPAGFIEAFANYYNDIAESLKNYISIGKFISEEVFGIDESDEGIILFEAVDRSSKENRWIELYTS